LKLHGLNTVIINSHEKEENLDAFLVLFAIMQKYVGEEEIKLLEEKAKEREY